MKFFEATPEPWHSPCSHWHDLCQTLPSENPPNSRNLARSVLPAGTAVPDPRYAYTLFFSFFFPLSLTQRSLIGGSSFLQAHSAEKEALENKNIESRNHKVELITSSFGRLFPCSCFEFCTQRLFRNCL